MQSISASIEAVCRKTLQVGKRLFRSTHIIADNLSKAGFSLRWFSAVDLEGRAIWIADAHRGDGKRFIVRADEKLTAFLELDRRSARKAMPYMEIRLCLTGPIYTVSFKTLPVKKI